VLRFTPADQVHQHIDAAQQAQRARPRLDVGTEDGDVQRQWCTGVFVARRHRARPPTRSDFPRQVSTPGALHATTVARSLIWSPTATGAVADDVGVRAADLVGLQVK